MKRPSAVEKDAAVKGEAEPWRLLVLQSGGSPGIGMGGVLLRWGHCIERQAANRLLRMEFKSLDFNL